MKQTTLILLMAIIAAFSACSNDNGNDTPPAKGLDPASAISMGIRNVQRPQSRSLDKTDPKFITLYAWDNTAKSGIYASAIRYVSGETDELYYRNRDTVNWKIKFMGWDVISETGEISTVPKFTNVILRARLDSNGNYVNLHNYGGNLDLPVDTIGYIPNEMMKRNLERLTELFDAGDYEGCYAMFDSAYYFIPITGAEYRKLVADGTEVRDTVAPYN